MIIVRQLIFVVFLFGVVSIFGGVVFADDFNRSVLPIPDQPFKGKTPVSKRASATLSPLIAPPKFPAEGLLRNFYFYN